MKDKTFINICDMNVEIIGRLIRVARVDGEQFTSPPNPAAALTELRRLRNRVDIFTFLQRPPDASPKYDYPMEMDNLAVVGLSTFEQWLGHQVHRNVRVKIRKAEKSGITVREVPFDDRFLLGLCAVYNEAPIRQGRPFPHYGIKLEEARRYAGTFLDRSIFIGAFLNDDTMIGFAKIVIDENRIHACILHILSMLRHRDKSITNALIAQAVKSCVDRNLAYLSYGRFTYGRKQEDSLVHFKAVNGFRQFELPRYYVPLTTRGRIALHFGLHHSLFERIPEPVLAKFRNLRSAWYLRKLQAKSEVAF